MTDLTSLIERIEAATGPDRRLDIDICVALDVETSWHGDLASLGYKSQSYIALGTQPYTASIDAALTLLPEGMDWRLERNTDIRMGFGAAVFEPGTPGKYPGIRLYSGATPCLALLAAILRARQTEGR